MHRPYSAARARSLRAACLAAAALSLAAPAAQALDIVPDPKLFSVTQTFAVSQSQVSWNLSRLDAKVSGGEGVVAWALLGPTDLPSSSKVRTAWLEREILRIHERLGNKDKITVSMPRHFEPSALGGGTAFTGPFEVAFPDRKSLSPIFVMPLGQGQGRFVVFGLMGKDEMVAKAAADFASVWAERLIAGK